MVLAKQWRNTHVKLYKCIFCVEIMISQLEDKIKKESITSFGDVFKYRMIYFGKTDQEECVTIEEFIDGTFTKYINNNGLLCVDGSDALGQKAECLIHFSYEKSEKKLMLVDIQSKGYDLFDPEIFMINLSFFIALETFYQQPQMQCILYFAWTFSDAAQYYIYFTMEYVTSSVFFLN